VFVCHPEIRLNIDKMNKKRLLLITFCLLIYNHAYSNEAVRELDSIYEKENITSNEYNKAKKIILDTKKNNQKLISPNNIKNNKEFITKRKRKKNKKSKALNLEDLESLGVYVKLKVSDYPEGMYSYLATGCKSNICIANKASKKMGMIFKRSPKWAEKNPGQLIKAMGYFELLYWNKLREGNKSLTKYKDNYHLKYHRKKNHEKKIRSLISLNKGRKKMREALGMSLDLSTKEVLKRYWILGSFLDLGVGKDLKKISPELQARRKLLAEYRNNISKLKKKLKDDNETR